MYEYQCTRRRFILVTCFVVNAFCILRLFVVLIFSSAKTRCHSSLTMDTNALSIEGNPRSTAIVAAHHYLQLVAFMLTDDVLEDGASNAQKERKRRHGKKKASRSNHRSFDHQFATQSIVRDYLGVQPLFDGTQFVGCYVSAENAFSA